MCPVLRRRAVLFVAPDSNKRKLQWMMLQLSSALCLHLRNLLLWHCVGWPGTKEAHQAAETVHFVKASAEASCKVCGQGAQGTGSSDGICECDRSSCGAGCRDSASMQQFGGGDAGL